MNGCRHRDRGGRWTVSRRMGVHVQLNTQQDPRFILSSLNPVIPREAQCPGTARGPNAPMAGGRAAETVHPFGLRLGARRFDP